MRKLKFSVFVLIALAALVALAACGTGEKLSSVTVNFDTNGGKIIAAVTYNEGDVLALPTPEREGYEFAGWFTDKALTKPLTDEGFSASGDVTLYACWKALAATHTVTFETNGGSAIEPVTLVEGTSFSAPTPKKEEYVFSGWYFDQALTEPFDEATFSATEDVTLYAKWEVRKYEIRVYSDEENYVSHYYAKGETVDISEWYAPEYFFEGDKVEFDCWMDETFKFAATENFVMGSESMAFYATYDMPQLFGWSYDPQTQVYTSTRAAIRPVKGEEGGLYGTFSADIEVTNRDTAGVGIIWNLDEGEADYPYNAADVSYWYFHLNPSNGGFQLSIVRNDEYDVIKVLSFANSPASWKEKWTAYNLGETQTLSMTEYVEFTPQYIKVYMDGALMFDYAGAELGALTGEHVGVRANRLGNIMKNPEFTPYPQYRVTFETNGGSAVEPTLVWKGGAISPVFSELDGYTLSGWYLDEALTEKVDFATFTVTKDLTLYAGWRERVFKKVSFDTQGACEMQSIKWEVGTAIGVADPTLDGWTFDGWYLDEARTEKFDAFEYLPEEDFTLYAEFTKKVNKFTVSRSSGKYVSGGSTAAIYASGDEYSYGKWSADITLGAPARIGLFINAYAENVTSYLNGVKGIAMYFNATVPESVDYSAQVSSCYNALGYVEGADGERVQSSNRPSGSGKFSDMFASDSKTYLDYSAFINGNASSVTLNFAIEKTLDYIAIYIDGVQFVKYTGEYREIWNKFTGVGFFADAAGVTFDKFNFIPLEKYTVTFESNGGSAVAAQSCYSGSKPVAVDNPTKENATFAGWYLDEDLTERASLTELVVTKDVTLYAKWVDNALIHELSFETNGGNAIENAEWVEGSVLTVTAPTREGYTFAGWFYDAACKEPADLEALTFTANGTLYAEWTYKLHNFTVYERSGRYVANGASFATVIDEARYGTTEATITLRYKSGTLRYGVYFASTQNESGTNWSNAFDAYLLYQGLNGNFRLVSNAKVFQLWPDGVTKADLKTAAYSTAFGDDYADFKAGTLSDFTFTVKIEYTPEKIAVSVNDVTVITITEHLDMFDGTGIALAAPDGNVTFENITFTPAPKHTLTVYMNGQGEDTTKQLVEGEKIVSSIPASAEYTFDGWYYDQALTQPLGDNAVMGGGDMTVYAKWIEKVYYTISFVTDGGTEIQPVTVEKYGVIESVADPELEGYDFAGWYEDQALTTAADIYSPATASATYYAKWIFTATYELAETYAFNSGEMLNTGITVDWSKDFTLETTINIPAVGARYAIFSTYKPGNGNSCFTVEVSAKNYLRLYLVSADGTVKDSNSGGTKYEVKANTDTFVKLVYTAATHNFVVTMDDGEKTLTAMNVTYDTMTGFTPQPIAIGGADYRGGTTFKAITVKAFKYSVTADKGESISASSGCVRAGYTFGGWFTDKTYAEGSRYTADTLVSGVTLYGKTTKDE